VRLSGLRLGLVQNFDAKVWVLGKSTWNGSMHRYACLEAVRKSFLRKMACQEVQSASPTREARLLTPQLARSNSSAAFA
jgi:hypothetical protein